jgi:arylsulfatase
MRCSGLWSLCVLLLLGAIVAPSPAADPARPNVIIVLVDDAGYGDFACLGNPVTKTPHCDKLHRESIRLTDFHVCPMCTPTRSQIMTGLSCLANGAMNVSSGRTPLRRNIPTMADIFLASGYATGHFGKWHLGDTYPYRPIDRGFQESITCRSWGMASAADHWNNCCFDDHYWHNGTVKRFPGYNTDVFFGEAMKWMKARKDKGEPFFVYLPLTAVHGPHFVAEKYRALYKDQKPQIASFFGMLTNLDEDLGKLDTFLATEKLRDNTILIFMTDNGGTAGVPVHNAGMRGRKMELWEGGHRVPCFLRWPAGKLRAPGDIPDLTQCQDLLPTLIELCGLKKPAEANFDGISLAPALRSDKEPVPDRTLIVQYSRINPQRPQKGDACVMWQRWRLVGDKELFDLKADPAQKDNVIEKHPDIVKKLRAHYDAWWAKIEKGLDEFQPLSIGAAAEPVTRLTPCDWQDSHCDQAAQVRRGEKRNAPWNVLVERDGEYEISLRRWPAEADLPITAASPPFKGPEGSNFPAGVALPVAKARLKIGDTDRDAPVKETDKAITFTVTLKAGRTQLQTWFYDAAGKELCGAYYTDVRRK